MLPHRSSKAEGKIKIKSRGSCSIRLQSRWEEGPFDYNMKWITLKPNNLPVVALEIDRAIQVFNSLLSQVEVMGQANDVHQLDTLRHQFEIRMSQLDSYYRQHSTDDNISIFHRLKLKLNKVIFLYDRFERADQKHKNSYQEKISQMEKSDESLFLSTSAKILDQPLFQYYQNSPKKNRSKSIKKSQAEEKPEKGRLANNKPLKGQKMEDSKNQKASINSKAQSRISSKNEPSKKQPIRKPLKQEVPKMKQMTRLPGKSIGGQGIDTPAFRDQSMNPAQLLEEMRQSSDLKFTIKMTKQEYRELLELKQQMKAEGKL